MGETAEIWWSIFIHKLVLREILTFTCQTVLLQAAEAFFFFLFYTFNLNNLCASARVKEAPTADSTIATNTRLRLKHFDTFSLRCRFVSPSLVNVYRGVSEYTSPGRVAESTVFWYGGNTLSHTASYTMIPTPLLSVYINYSSRTGYCYQFHLQCYLLERVSRVMHRLHCGFYSCFLECAPDEETVSSSHVAVSSPQLRFSFFFCTDTPWGVTPQTHTMLYVPDVGRVLSLTQRHGSVLPSLPRDFELLFFFSKKKMDRVCVCVCEAVSSCRLAAPLLSESELRSCHAKAQPVSVNIDVTGWVTSSSSDCSTLTSETPYGSAVYV